MTSSSEALGFTCIILVPLSFYLSALLFGVSDWSQVPSTTGGFIRVVAAVLLPIIFWTIIFLTDSVSHLLLWLAAFVILSMFIAIVFGSVK